MENAININNTFMNNEISEINLNNLDFEESRTMNKKNYTSYSDIMNNRNSIHHILALIMYVLSLIAFEFFILQNFIMIRPYMPNTKVEIITFLTLSFFTFSCSWFVKHVLMEFYYTKSIFISSSLISLLMNTLIIITKSFYIFHLCYIVISFFFGLIFFTSHQLLNEFYIDNKLNKKVLLNKLFKDLLYSIVPLSGFLVIYNTYLVEPNVNSNNWNLTFIAFDCLIFLIFIISLFIKESPLILIKNKNNEEEIIGILEYINKRILQYDEINALMDEMTILCQNNEKSKYLELFHKNSMKTTLLYSMIIFIIAYIYTNMISSIPNRVYIYTLNLDSQDRVHVFYEKLILFFAISFTGYMTGIGLTNIKQINSKWIIITGFLIVAIFSYFIAYWNYISILFAGFTLFVAYKLMFVTENMSHEIYSSQILQHNGYKIFYFIFFISCTISIIIIECSNSDNMINHFIMSGLSILGIILMLIIK